MSDPKRPKQASLRRAISAAYYAVFHLLTANAAQRFIPRRPIGLISRVERAFSHGEMKQACKSFDRRQLVGPVAAMLGTSPSDELRSIAAAFVELQEARHEADYNTGAVFLRPDTLAILARADFVFVTWKKIQGTEEATVFLAALAFGARWSK